MGFYKEKKTSNHVHKYTFFSSSPFINSWFTYNKKMMKRNDKVKKRSDVYSKGIGCNINISTLKKNNAKKMISFILKRKTKQKLDILLWLVLRIQLEANRSRFFCFFMFLYWKIIMIVQIIITNNRVSNIIKKEWILTLFPSDWLFLFSSLTHAEKSLREIVEDEIC